MKIFQKSNGVVQYSYVQKKILSLNLFQIRCGKYVEDAVEIVGKIIGEEK